MDATKRGTPRAETRPPRAARGKHGGQEGPGQYSRGLHLFACLTACSTFFLIIAGGLVTSTGSGLAVPDWPLSFGMMFPPMVGGVFYEHGHRMVAGTVATLMAILAVWLARSEPRRWVKGLGFTALGAVILQALLGGMTVLLLLPPAVSIAHACLAQTFFCLTVSIALVTSRRWTAADSATHPVGDSFASGSLTESLAVLTFASVYVQLILGAVMRHMEAGLAIPDFPLAFGRLLPPHWSGPIAIHFAHRIWAIAVVALGTSLVVRILRARRERPDLRWPAILLAILFPLQVILGAATVLSLKQVFFATAHVAMGALILATSLVLAIRVCRSRVEGSLAARASRIRSSAREGMISPATP